MTNTDEEAPYGYTKAGKARKRPPTSGSLGSHEGRSAAWTSTGKVKDVPAVQDTWRTRLQQSRIKFDDEQKEIYVNALAKNSLKGRAAQEAGVCSQTVNRHMENDPEFAANVLEAMSTYRDKVVDHAQNLLFNGETHMTYDKDGNVLSEKTIFPIRLIELELKRVDPGYRDKQTIDLTTKQGGVMVAPAELTPEEWIAASNKANETMKSPADRKAEAEIVDAEFEDITPTD